MRKWKWKSLSRVQLGNPMNYTVHGVLQARILEWAAFPFSRGSSQPRDQTQVSCIAGGFFTSWASREAHRSQNQTQLKWLSSSSRFVITNAGDLGLIPGLWRSPGEGKGYPLQHSDLENSMDCIVHGVAKSRTGLSDFHFTRKIK